MTVRNFGREQVATLALVAAMLSAALPARAQDTTTSPRPIDFRLPPPADDGRTPGVQGPSDNGLPPVAPGERRGPPTPTPAPTPTQPVAPPRIAPTQPAAATPAPAPAPTRRGAPAVAAPRTAAPETANPGAPAATDNPALPPLETAAPPAATAADAAPITADETPVAAAPADAPSGTPIWAWVLTALAAVGAGFWYWRRRAAPAGPAIDESPEAPRRAPKPPVQRAASPASPKPVAPKPTQPVAPRPAAPQPARAPLAPPERPLPSPLVTRPAAEKRAIIGMALDIRSIRFAADHVAVGFALHLMNQGPTAATGLMVRIALNQGSAMTEPVLARFFDGAGGSVLRDDMMLAPGAGEELSTEVMLPRAAIEPLMIGGKPMLVPVIAFDVTYHWDGEGDAFGQNAGSFVLGREQGASGSEKLAPLPLDRASYTVDRPAARSTAVKRAQ
ncbi:MULTISPECIES: hypothetical protein [unclassified Sphingopyxis]|uniref:hypothetical protein n=1 Tax=unclassified Sphingopyxis TaxID=2614943 RepID=UPI00285E1A1E|nr:MULTISPECIES: hypothetical protein [unclassified Sphingopyxis]MDR7058443.1 hypothetical protein [Sphingopyxis sp. BE235]MDR7179371.1 hypothetical protein [Sphingopyxis sp. BE249]